VRYRHRWGLAAVTTMLLLVAGLVGGPASASAADPSWQYTRTGLAPLTNARQWVLVGTKQSSGACRYQYPSGEAAVPASGWTLRTIAIDMIGCRKLFEEGVPTSFSTDAGDGSAQALVAGPAAASSMAAVSTKSAWQRVIWRDLAGLLTTAVMVEITWNLQRQHGLCGQHAWRMAVQYRDPLATHRTHPDRLVRIGLLVLSRAEHCDLLQQLLLRTPPGGSYLLLLRPHVGSPEWDLHS
jgi:hypothetical protein